MVHSIRVLHLILVHGYPVLLLRGHTTSDGLGRQTILLAASLWGASIGALQWATKSEHLLL